MKNYNLAIIGFGGMGNWHRELINEGGWWDGRQNNKIERIKVKGSFDIDESRQQAAREKGIIAYNCLEELLNDPEIDIVLVSTPNDFHKPLIIKALEAGKNAVSEKPVTMNSAFLQEMIDASKKAGKIFTVHQNRRWDEDYLTVKKIYDNNMLGDIFRIESRVHGSRGIHGWRSEPEKGGGIVLDWGVHILDQALQMIKGKVKKVYATLTNVTNELVDDGFFVDLTFDNGLVYHAESGTSNFINLPRWYVLGRDGSAIINGWNSSDGKIVRVTNWNKDDAVPIKTAAGLTKTMAPRTDETIKEEPLPNVNSDIRDFYKNLIAVMEGKEELCISLESVMRTMKLIEAVFRSAKSGKPEDFE